MDSARYDGFADKGHGLCREGVMVPDKLADASTDANLRRLSWSRSAISSVRIGRAAPDGGQFARQAVWRTRISPGEQQSYIAGQPPLLTIVVPCFNEAEVLPETARRLRALLDRLAQSRCVAPESHTLFVDDGSTDLTWTIIQNLRLISGQIGGLKLSRNRGHQAALVAGLLAAQGDLVISVDADLQDDLEAIDGMLQAWRRGADIVYGVRATRTADTAAKRISAHLYYKLLTWLKVEVVFDHADFRLMTRRAVEALRQYDESNLFLRALIPQLGFAVEIVTYERAERFAGTSKYPLPKMFALAMEGVTSFSVCPLRIITALGCVMSLFALGLTSWALVVWLIFAATVPGWASTVIPIYLVCGVQLLSMGVIGEYVGKIYLETKRRPRYHIAETLTPEISADRSSSDSKPSHTLNNASPISA